MTVREGEVVMRIDAVLVQPSGERRFCICYEDGFEQQIAAVMSPADFARAVASLQTGEPVKPAAKPKAAKVPKGKK